MTTRKDRLFGASRQEAVRDQIEVSKIVKRLQKHALGESEMDAGQIKAAEILLKKSIPDLTSIDIGNKTGETLKFELGIKWLSQAIQDRNK